MLRENVVPKSAKRAASVDGSAAEVCSAVGLFPVISAATTVAGWMSVPVPRGMAPAGRYQPQSRSGGNVGRQERDPLPLTRSTLSGGAVGADRIAAPSVVPVFPRGTCGARQERLHG